MFTQRAFKNFAFLHKSKLEVYRLSQDSYNKEVPEMISLVRLYRVSQKY